MKPARTLPLVVLSSALLLAACGGPGATPPETTPPADTSILGSGSATVTGYLANSTGGKLVPGSQITVEQANGTPLTGATNAEGKFTLKLDPGVYNLSFKKEGYAASRIEGLRVMAGSNMPLNAIQKNAFATTLPANAPRLDVKYLLGKEAQDFSNDPATAAQFNASTGVPVQVTTTSANPENSPSITYVGVGSVPSSALFGTRGSATTDPKNTSFTAAVTLAGNSLRGVRGPTELYVVAYDSNENRLERRIPIVIVDDKPNDAALTSVRDAKARAVTISQKVNFNAPIGPDGAPTEQSTLWVDLSWNYVSGLAGAPLGTRVWTSEDGNTFRLLKTLEGAARATKDGSPSLEAGKKVYYQYEVFNSGQSVRSDVVSTTPLTSFTLSNLKPADHDKGVSRTPTLAWNVSSKVGDYRQFYVMVNDYPQQSANCFWGEVLCSGEAEDNLFSDDGTAPELKNAGDTYSIAFNANSTALLPALESNHAYTFDVSAAAFSKSGDAVSIAQDYYSIFYSLDLCNFGGPVCEGLVSNFTTGDK
ncbi:carboxypeptidase-like regulatory domain-containing protein [Deinococcus budaensis]|uniref:Carboxypeptidase regulatory-like domain-containing protein n=1 Tax=Deinococcus budaensis TaxID=1665626 RepID=A0A7W8GFQ4_9DEIO|nr:carboxypeptidase-like regulatory domain-containing protein [Deinococcus budaensis]MBB5234613.1 hypothetical protein [Deinococcus budaensis]